MYRLGGDGKSYFSEKENKIKPQVECCSLDRIKNITETHLKSHVATVYKMVCHKSLPFS